MVIYYYYLLHLHLKVDGSLETRVRHEVLALMQYYIHMWMILSWNLEKYVDLVLHGSMTNNKAKDGYPVI